MRIYLKIDKTVKMHTAAIKVYILVVFSLFPVYKRHFRKFWCFVFSLTKKKAKLGYPTLPEEKAPKLSFSPLQSLRNFAWAQNEDSPSLKNVNLVPDIGPWPQKDEKGDKKIWT